MRYRVARIEPGTAFAVTLCVFAWYSGSRQARFMRSQTPPQAVLLPRERGGWLAISAPDEQVRLAVQGDTEDDARDAFGRSAGRWMELCEAATMRDEDG